MPLVSSRSASYYVEEAEEEGRAAATSSCSLDAPLVSSRGASYYVEEEAEVAAAEREAAAAWDVAAWANVAAAAAELSDEVRRHDDTLVDDTLVTLL